MVATHNQLLGGKALVDASSQEPDIYEQLLNQEVMLKACFRFGLFRWSEPVRTWLVEHPGIANGHAGV